MTTNNAINSQSPIQVIMGGTGLNTTTAYAPICAGTTATGAFQAASTGISNSGYVLTSNGSVALPTWQPGGGGGVNYLEVTSGTQAMSNNYIYGANNAGGVVFTLPTTAAVGTSIEIIGIDGIWSILKNAGQTIYYGNADTSSGPGLLSTVIGDSITLICITADTNWRASCGWGNFVTIPPPPPSSILFSAGYNASRYMYTPTGNSYETGFNNAGYLGIGNTTDQSSPVQVLGGITFVPTPDVGSGLWLDSSGNAWTSGSNSSGQLGIETTTDQSSPVLVHGNHSFVKVQNGAGHMHGLKADGSVWSWGANQNVGFGNGALGDGTITDRSSPVLVIGNNSFVDIASGNSSINCLELKSDGSVWAWGANQKGQIGDETMDDKSSPTLVHGNHSFIAIASGMQTSFGLKDDGSIWAWGDNTYNQLGTGAFDTTPYSSPVEIVGNFSFIAISCTGSSTAGLKANGEIWMWGDDSYGQLGDLTNFGGSIGSPVQVVGNHSFIAVSAGPQHTLAKKDNNTIWAWGDNSRGQFGDGTNDSQSSPVQVLPIPPVATFSIFAGAYASGFIKASTKDSYDTGFNDSKGRLGIGNTSDQSSPVLVLGGLQYLYMDIGSPSNIWLDNSGNAWTCGAGTYGVLGNGTTTDTSSPVQVIGNHSFMKISTSAGFCAGLKTDGTIWAWGENTYGNLGDETDINQSSPVLVHGNHSFVTMSCGLSNILALKENGEVWCWGENYGGQIGDETDINQSSPVLVHGNHSFINIQAGGSLSIGLKANGSVWAWGDSAHGDLGNGSFAPPYSSPILVIGNHSFIYISAKFNTVSALKVDGTAWMWGDNEFGQLGDDTMTDKNSPNLVHGNHSFIAINCGGYHTLALKSDGTIWAWGDNTYGEFGNNTIVSSSSPIQIM